MEDLPPGVQDALRAILERISGYGDLSSNDKRLCVVVIQKFLSQSNLMIKDIPANSSWDDKFNYLRRGVREYLFMAETSQIEDEAENFAAAWKSEDDKSSFGYAILSSDEKQRIIIHIENIRTMIENSLIDARKKTKIFDKLTKLYNEILRNSTKTDDFFAFMGDMAFVIGDMAESAKPAITEVKEILRIVMGNRAKREGVALPKRDDLPQLPGPNHSEGE